MSPTQPAPGLAEMFGVREALVEFMPDIAERDRVVLHGEPLPCGGFRQGFYLHGAEALGHFDTGEEAAAVTTSRHGSGATLLIGSHVSVGHFRERDAEGVGARAWWRHCLDFAGIEPRVFTGNPHLVGRLHEGPDGTFLWLVNPTRQAQSGFVRVDGKVVNGRALWGKPQGGERLTVPGRDAVVFAL